MIKEITPEQMVEIEKIKQNWVDLQTYQFPDEDMLATAKEMLKLVYNKDYDVQIADSPKAAMELAKDGDEPQEKYCSWWWQSWAAWYEAGKYLGVQFDEAKYDLFRRWCMHCVFICGPKPTISRRPIEVHWDNGVLHNDKGMSVKFADGWGIWTLRGVQVDEQIVMRPETQTIKQITDEQNQEVKAIRIERFGWEDYLLLTGAKAVDRRTNDIDGSKEVLWKTPTGETALMCACPSTAKLFFLGVDNEVETCENAQAYISCGLSSRTISAS